MKAPPHRSIRPALALALCAGLLCPPASAQSEAPAGVDAPAASRGGVDHAVSVARRQMAGGQLVAARETLKQALAAEGTLMSGPAIAEALELHKELQRAIRQANPVD